MAIVIRSRFVLGVLRFILQGFLSCLVFVSTDAVYLGAIRFAIPLLDSSLVSTMTL